MPKNFNDSLSTQTVGPGSFGAGAYVDSEGNLDGLGKAVEAAADLSNKLVLNSFNNASEAEQQGEEELYSKARQLKRNIFDAGVAGDEAAELEFQGKLEDLKIAERQGAISGTNSQIRQETVLKNYINRFPHLEDQFRKSASATRARAEAQREQFKDPIETGIDELITAATKEGLSVKAYLNIKQKEQQLSLDMKNLEYKAKLGVSIEADIDDVFQSKIVPLSVASAQRTITQGLKALQDQGLDYDGNKAKADFIFRGELEASAVAQELNNIVRTVGGPDAVVSREFRDSRVAQIRKVYSDIAASGVFDSLDTLQAMERGMKIGTIEGLQQLAKFSPLMAEAVRLDPKNGFEFVYKDFNKTLEVYKSGRRKDLELAAEGSNPIDASRIKYQLAVIDSWGQGELAKDYTSMVQDGSPVATSGDADIDAAKTSILTRSVLNSSSSTPEQKAKTVQGAIAAEQQLSKPGEYKGPSAVWYKDPARAKTLQTNEQAKKTMTTEVDNSAANLVESFKPELAKKIKFETLKDKEDPKEPWKSYGVTGGPFSAGEPTVVSTGGLHPRQVVGGEIKALNNMYWTYRKMHGPTAAYMWSQRLVKGLQQPEGDAQDDTLDFDLTD